MRDAITARNLIEEAARLGYGHTATLRAVEEQDATGAAGRDGCGATS